MTFNSFCMQKRTKTEKTGNGPSVATANRLPLKRLEVREGKHHRLCGIYEIVSGNGDLDQLPAREVARRYQVSKNTVLKWYSQKPHGWSAYVDLRDGNKLTVAQKINRHGGAGVMLVPEMAKEIGIHEATLYRYMRENGIKVPKPTTPLFNPKTKLNFVESMMMKWK